VQFGFDKNDTLWASSAAGGGVVGWLTPRSFLETGDAQNRQGLGPRSRRHLPADGQRGEYTEPEQAARAGKDMRIARWFYAVMPSPVDGTVWGTLRANPGAVVRPNSGQQTRRRERASPKSTIVASPGFGPRGGDIDSKGVSGWSLASGHSAASIAGKCKGPLTAQNPTGNHCPEGWAFYKYPGPGFEGIGDNSAESSYNTWVDQHNTLEAGQRRFRSRPAISTMA